MQKSAALCCRLFLNKRGGTIDWVCATALRQQLAKMRFASGRGLRRVRCRRRSGSSSPVGSGKYSRPTLRPRETPAILRLMDPVPGRPIYALQLNRLLHAVDDPVSAFPFSFFPRNRDSFLAQMIPSRGVGIVSPVDRRFRSGLAVELEHQGLFVRL